MPEMHSHQRNTVRHSKSNLIGIVITLQGFETAVRSRVIGNNVSRCGTDCPKLGRLLWWRRADRARAQHATFNLLMLLRLRHWRRHYDVRSTSVNFRLVKLRPPEDDATPTHARFASLPVSRETCLAPVIPIHTHLSTLGTNAVCIEQFLDTTRVI